MDRDSGVRFVEERDELDIKYIVSYLRCLIKYEGAFESAACEDVGIYLKRLETIYLQNIARVPTRPGPSYLGGPLVPGQSA